MQRSLGGVWRRCVCRLLLCVCACVRMCVCRLGWQKWWLRWCVTMGVSCVGCSTPGGKRGGEKGALHEPAQLPFQLVVAAHDKSARCCRYTYGSVKRYRESIREVLQQNAAAGGPTRDAAPAKSLPEPEPDYDPGQDDAVATIIAWLHSRVPHTRGPPADGGSPAATGAQQQAAVTRAGQA
jgi:hypothetical protein